MNGTQKAWFGAGVAALVAFLSVLAGALTAGQSISELDAQTWLFAIIAALGALPVVGGTVYQTTNKANHSPSTPPYPDLEP